MPVYKTHYFPPIVVSKSGSVLYVQLELFKFKNAFKSREIDPKRWYFHHTVYCYVMAELLLQPVREVTVISVYIKLVHCKNNVSFIFRNFT